MICITIAQESRRFALVDMHNSARQCDLLEIRLDCFGMAPDLGELLEHKPTPIIMSCRRQEDGGEWDGTDEERLALLRQCIVSEVDYVEIELDAADEIPRMGSTKRVISCYFHAKSTPADIAETYALAQAKDPDVIKLTTMARTPEAAWPFVQIMAKPPVPTVIHGIGKPGIMLTILGKKIGSPWTYAALERGMEAYPAQPTVHDLREVYHYEDIEKGTRLIGVTGFHAGKVVGAHDREYYTVAGLNAALRNHELKARCLPLAVGDANMFRKIVNAVKLASVIVEPGHQDVLPEMAEEKHPTVTHSGLVDLLLHKGENWHGYFSQAQAAVEALGMVLKERIDAENPFRDRVVLIVGLNPVSRLVAADLNHRKASLVIASQDKDAAQELAQKFSCRFVPFEAIYRTNHNALIVGEDVTSNRKTGGGSLHPSLFKTGQVVMDLDAGVRSSPLLREASERGSTIVPPWEVLLQDLDLQMKLISGKSAPREVFLEALKELTEEG
ncbi:MAG: type I 3-dehydroquinate dehydratase [Gemmataceae bacterium]